MKSNIFDINNVELEVGQRIKFWNFYTNSGSSQDWFGTEPQNSYTVYEEYMDWTIGEIVFELGSYCVKTSSQIISLRDYFNKTSNEIIDYFRCEWGGKFIDFIDDEQFFSQELVEMYTNLVEKYEKYDFSTKSDIIFDDYYDKIEEESDEWEEFWNKLGNYINTKIKQIEVI